MTDVTLDDVSQIAEEREGPQPGVLVVFAAGAPQCRPIPLEAGRLVLGRHDASGALDDERISREHTELKFAEGEWTIRDLGSRNGTFVDGQSVRGQVTHRAPQVLRLGATILVFHANLHPFLDGGVRVRDDLVAGPSLRQALERVAWTARHADRLLITGESGAGKELAAKTFHAAGPHTRGRFIAVNCAAIPEGVAERLLFGALRGAYSGATHDAEGYVQAAHEGVLFLDEIGELDLDVQAKLLRVIERSEVLPLGASVPRRVNARICFATNRDLRAEVAADKFRDDLYYRLAQCELHLPPLRERREEIPYYISRALGEGDAESSGPAGLTAHPKLVEACLLRPWPGNVRELNGAIRRAAQTARAAGSGSVRADHLEPHAGQPLHGEIAAPQKNDPPSREAVEAALREHQGNMAATARALGLHRTQLYRLVERYGLKPTS